MLYKALLFKPLVDWSKYFFLLLFPLLLDEALFLPLEEPLLGDVLKFFLILLLLLLLPFS